MPDAPRKIVPLGKPLNLTDKQLEDESRITEVDIEKARVFWHNHAPGKWKTLLDAQPIDEQPDDQ